MTDTIRTAGDLRGFLADVLVGIREKRIRPDEAGAIAKVAAEINRSLAVEVQTQLASGVKDPVPGSMVIANEPALQTCAISQVERTDAPKIITENIQADPIDPAKVSKAAAQPKPKIAVVCPPRAATDKFWCDQCDQSVTTSQAVSCKSAFCKAKDAA